MTRFVFPELGLRKITQSCDTLEGVDLFKCNTECCSLKIRMSLRNVEISLGLTFIDKRISLKSCYAKKHTRVTLQWYKLFIVTFYYAPCRNLL